MGYGKEWTFKKFKFKLKGCCKKKNGNLRIEKRWYSF
jgi:hypothetical protein